MSAAWELELGRLPDAQVAALAGVSAHKVRDVRLALGIPARFGRTTLARQREEQVVEQLRLAGDGGATVGEIAAATGIPERAVRSALRRLHGRRLARSHVRLLRRADRLVFRATHLHCWRLWPQESR